MAAAEAKSIFIFGGTGFVGRNLLEALRGRGYGITVLVRNPRERLSRHLSSRAEVCRIIRQSGFPHTILRASIIFGPGSASYEILKAALSLPVVPLPPWRRTRVQPITASDIIRCLVAAIEHPNPIY